MKTEDVIRKVRALLAKSDADRNDNVHERETALRMANALMDKYQIEISDVDTDELGPRGRTSLKVGRRPWQRIILLALADLYGCSTFATKRTGEMHIIGREHYRAIIIDMATWIRNSIQRESNRMNGSRSFCSDFRKGAAMAVYDNAKAIMAARKTDAPEAVPGTAMVLVNSYQTERDQNDQYRTTHYGRMVKGAGPKLRNSSGYQTGQRYGSGISLNGQMNGSTQKRLA